jgi:hypothetical protein
MDLNYDKLNAAIAQLLQVDIPELDPDNVWTTDDLLRALVLLTNHGWKFKIYFNRRHPEEFAIRMRHTDGNKYYTYSKNLRFAMLSAIANVYNL